MMQETKAAAQAFEANDDDELFHCFDVKPEQAHDNLYTITYQGSWLADPQEVEKELNLLRLKLQEAMQMVG